MDRRPLYGPDMSSPLSSTRPLQVLLLSDGRPGHYHLAEGVAAAIRRRRPIVITRREVRRPGWLPGRALPSLVRLGPRGTSLVARLFGLSGDLPPTDLVISAGGETMAANAAVASKLGVANIFCGSLRRLEPEAFSLVVSSYGRHATLPRHIVTLKPSGIDPDTLQRGDGTRTPSDAPRTAGPPDRWRLGPFSLLGRRLAAARCVRRRHAREHRNTLGRLDLTAQPPRHRR